MDPETHIYCENKVDTLCGKPNHQNQLKQGFFFTQEHFLLFNDSRNIHTVNRSPIQSRYRGDSSKAKGPLPELGEDNNYIVMPGARAYFAIYYMCNDCLAIMKLREME